MSENNPEPDSPYPTPPQSPKPVPQPDREPAPTTPEPTPTTPGAAQINVTTRSGLKTQDNNIKQSNEHDVNDEDETDNEENHPNKDIPSPMAQNMKKQVESVRLKLYGNCERMTEKLDKLIEINPKLEDGTVIKYNDKTVIAKKENNLSDNMFQCLIKSTNNIAMTNRTNSIILSSDSELISHIIEWVHISRNELGFGMDLHNPNTVSTRVGRVKPNPV